MSRVSKLQDAIKAKKMDAMLVTSQYNLRYVSNFTGTTGLAVITQEEAFFVTDFRYTQQAASQAQGFQIIQNKGPIFDEVKKIAEEKGLASMGFEDAILSFRSVEDLEDLVTCDLIPASGIIEELREVKDEDEIRTISRACEIADAGFLFILDHIRPGVSEIEIANRLDFHMRELGASGVSFETIVASGIRSAMPHGVASPKLIEKGDFVTLDFGCYYNGYVSDMTRTVSVGQPHAELKKIYEIVLAAQLRVNAAAKAGMSGIEVDSVAREYITEHGYGDAFGHSNGKRLQVGATYLGQRNSLGLVVFQSLRDSLVERDFAVSNDLQAGSQLRTTGATLTLSHQVTGLTNLNASFSSTRSRNEGLVSQSSDSRLLTVGVSSRLTPKATGMLNARRNEGSYTTSDYTENAVIGSLAIQF